MFALREVILLPARQLAHSSETNHQRNEIESQPLLSPFTFIGAAFRYLNFPVSSLDCLQNTPRRNVLRNVCRSNSFYNKQPQFLLSVV